MSANVLEIQSTFRELTKEEKEGLNLVESYDFTEIRNRVVKDGVVGIQEVDSAITEFRKYLALIILGNRNIAMMSGSVDEVWHAFILHTRDYAEFCLKAIGKFIHHQPASEYIPVSDESKRAFFDAYQSAFGTLSPVWGLDASCDYPKCSYAGCSNCDSDPGPSSCSGTTNCQDSDD